MNIICCWCSFGFVAVVFLKLRSFDICTRSINNIDDFTQLFLYTYIIKIHFGCAHTSIDMNLIYLYRNICIYAIIYSNRIDSTRFDSIVDSCFIKTWCFDTRSSFYLKPVVNVLLLLLLGIIIIFFFFIIIFCLLIENKY